MKRKLDEDSIRTTAEALLRAGKRNSKKSFMESGTFTPKENMTINSDKMEEKKVSPEATIKAETLLKDFTNKAENFPKYYNVVPYGIAEKATRLARTEEREKLIREAVIEVMKIKGSSTLELSIHSAVIEILNSLKKEKTNE